MKRNRRRLGYVRTASSVHPGTLLALAGAGLVAAYFVIKNRAETAPDADAGPDDGSDNGGLDIFADTKTVIGNSGLMTVAAVGNGQYMRPDAAAAFNRMVDAAAQAGVTILAGSGFRSVAQQTALYAAYIARAFTYPTVAKPGTSNHGNGTAMDVAVAPGVSVHYGTPQYHWLEENAGGFGFSWDEGQKVDEPWHWRYVG